MLRKERGITLIALVITVIVLLILAGVTIAMVVGDNGILTQAKKSKEQTNKATIKESIELAIVGALTEESNYTDVSAESLEKELARYFDISKINMIDNLDGTFAIYFMEENITYLVHGQEVEEIDWKNSFANEEAPAEQTETSKDIIGIGTNGKAVNMDLWEYCYDEVTNGYLLNDEEVSQNKEYNPNGTNTEKIMNNGYKGKITEEGKIEGFVPQYISEDKGENFKPVTSLYRTFQDLTDLRVQPNLPLTTLYMRSTFETCTNLANISLPSKVIDIVWCYGSTGITRVDNIPESVRKLDGVFYKCNSLQYANIKIPNGVESLNQVFAGDEQLKEAQITIPDSVINMSFCFNECKNLEKGPSFIPKNVNDMESTFNNCRKLSGVMKIEANPANGRTCFNWVGYDTIDGFIIKVKDEDSKSFLEKIVDGSVGNQNIRVEIDW